jgi:hypothetical protein
MTMHFSFLVTRNINLSGTLNTAESHPTNCINFTNNDCIVKYGEQAFCRDEKCYCDRRLSFIKAGKCGMSDRHERDQLFLVPIPVPVRKKISSRSRREKNFGSGPDPGGKKF